MSRSITSRRLVFNLIGFWLVWLIVQIFLNVPIENHLTGWSQELALDAIKLTVWLGAGAWFLHQAAPSDLYLANRDQWHPNWRFIPGYLVLALVIVYLVGQFILAHHGLRINHSFRPEFWGRYFLVVGISEEFVFRGYFLNVLLTRYSLTTANIIQAVAFASLHIPRYLTTVPAMIPMAWISNLVSVAALGALFGWLYARSKSLWPGIAVHMTWDILVTLFA